MLRPQTNQQEKNIFNLNSVYLQQIVSQGWKRYETDFEEIETLLKGTYYQVVKVINKIDQQVYAIKQIQICLKKQQQMEINIQRVLKEVRYLAQLNHPNIMRYYTSWIQMNEDEQELQQMTTNNSIKMIDILSPLKSPSYKRGIYDDQFIFPKQIDNKSSKERISYSEVESSDSESSETQSDRFFSEQKQKNKSLKISTQIISKSCGQKQLHVDKFTIFIQTEFCDQSLCNYLKVRNTLLQQNIEQQEYQLEQSYENALIISLNLISALEYIHQQCKLVHRDLRPDNIFINNENDVRIGDFGLMKKIKQLLVQKESSKQQYGFIEENTPFNKSSDQKIYVAPELLGENINKQYDNRIDIYSFGLILLLLFYPTFSQESQMQLLLDAKESKTLPLRFIQRNPIVSDIVIRCLDKDPNRRYSLDYIKRKLQEVHYQLERQQRMNCIELGIYKIKFEDEDIEQLKYLKLIDSQLYLFKSKLHKKAQAIYNIIECQIRVIENTIVIFHEQLTTISIILNDEEETQQLKQKLLLLK
ncbi:unnamed protein product [Paramecium pentaurelia]|uniref:non-specific serine/threonine protein kinase n=1 Tax=Paramecium pentaurelia TaxID=43138 RepID=A0A8S1WXG4_9CILI|nr:unnamed protein product [Paramecium pentaurelia]